MEAKLGIIGGTGIYDPNMLEDIVEEKVLSEFGEVLVKMGTYQGVRVAFVARHFQGHTLPPHLVNYRANIRALKLIGVEKIIATAAVGSINMQHQPGEFVLIDQFIDFTKTRSMTFYEGGEQGGEQGVVHVDMTEPYCKSLRRLIKEAAEEKNIALASGGSTYVCTEGPRFETPAEIQMYKHLGGHLVGMTSVPEVILAKEAEMCYATIAMVTNYAAGISPNPLTHKEVVNTMKSTQESLKLLIRAAIPKVNNYQRDCSCKNAIAELGKFK